MHGHGNMVRAFHAEERACEQPQVGKCAFVQGMAGRLVWVVQREGRRQCMRSQWVPGRPGEGL